MKITSPHIEELEKERKDHLTNAQLIQEQIEAARLAILEEEYGLVIGSIVTDSKGNTFMINSFVNFCNDTMCNGFKKLKSGEWGVHSKRMWDFKPVKQ